MTLVEILIGVAVLALLLSFAVPSLGEATARSELKAAGENIQFSIDAARNSARTGEKAVTLEFGSHHGEVLRIISFRADKPGANAGLQDYQLPEGILMLPDRDSFRFDEQGLVQNPGTITLVARSDEQISSSIIVK